MADPLIDNLDASRASSRVVVVGAGAIGLGIAWLLARAGCAVTVFDQQQVGREASWAAAGMLAPTAELEPDETALLALALRSQALWPDFAARLLEAGHDCGLDRRGTLLPALDADDRERLARLQRFQEAAGLTVHWLDGAAARRQEPMLSPGVHGAVWCPDDWNVDNRALVQGLEAAAVAAGATVRPHTRVRRVMVAQDRVWGVQIDTPDGPQAAPDEVPAEVVVVAAGAWSRDIGGLLPLRLPTRPVRGQMLSLQMPSDWLQHVVRAPDAYLVPKADGRLVIGATVEERGFDRRTTAGGLMDLLRGAWEAVPGVYELPVLETWVGFRPGSRDNLPLLGPVRSVRGLHVATGHYRNGIQQAPVSILGVVGGILSGDTDAVLLPFAADRFLHAATPATP